MDHDEIVRKRQGVLCAIGAHGLWGLIPIYFKWLKPLASDEILAHRIVWSLIFLAVVISLAGRWRDVRQAITNTSTCLTLIGSSILISVNWLAFLYAVQTDHVLDTSLGYFIMPLTNVALGVAILGERLRPAQFVSIALAIAGVLSLTWLYGQFPWIPITLAITFALYGLLRKKAPVDAIGGLTVETLLLTPIAIVALWYWHGGTAGISATYQQHGLLLGISGVVTAIPLLLFTGAARRLRLTTLGLLQNITPTISFIIAVFWYSEPFTRAHAFAFGCIWTGVFLYFVDSLLAIRRDSRESH